MWCIISHNTRRRSQLKVTVCLDCSTRWLWWHESLINLNLEKKNNIFIFIYHTKNEQYYVENAIEIRVRILSSWVLLMLSFHLHWYFFTEETARKKSFSSNAFPPIFSHPVFPGAFAQGFLALCQECVRHLIGPVQGISSPIRCEICCCQAALYAKVFFPLSFSSRLVVSLSHALVLDFLQFVQLFVSAASDWPHRILGEKNMCQKSGLWR